MITFSSESRKKSTICIWVTKNEQFLHVSHEKWAVFACESWKINTFSKRLVGAVWVTKNERLGYKVPLIPPEIGNPWISAEQILRFSVCYVLSPLFLYSPMRRWENPKMYVPELVRLSSVAPFSYLTLYCLIVNESSGPKRVTHHIHFLFSTYPY